MVNEPYIITDRSAAESDDKCGMKFWWQRLEGGKGIVPKEEHSALAIGKQIHEDFAFLAQLDDISPANLSDTVEGWLHELPPNATDTPRLLELVYRRLGWFVAFGLYIEPKIREQFETIMVEGEIILDRHPLAIAVTPDRVLRSRAQPSLIVYKEYKSAANPGKRWSEQWPYKIQLHLGLKALEEELKTKLHYAQIIGLDKGSYTKVQPIRLSHPYVWGWHNSKDGRWTCDYTKARASGWEPMPVWEYPGGIVEWVRLCGKEVALKQFPHSPPTFLNEHMLNKYIARRTARMRQVTAVHSACQTDLALRNLVFESRNGQCNPEYGGSCPYLRLCWNASAHLNPLATGDYTVREPHHDVEVVGVDE